MSYSCLSSAVYTAYHDSADSLWVEARDQCESCGSGQGWTDSFGHSQQYAEWYKEPPRWKKRNKSAKSESLIYRQILCMLLLYCAPGTCMRSYPSSMNATKNSRRPDMRVNLSPIQGSCMHIINVGMTAWSWVACIHVLCSLPDSLGLARGGTQRMEKSWRWLQWGLMLTLWLWPIQCMHVNRACMLYLLLITYIQELLHYLVWKERCNHGVSSVDQEISPP